MRKTALIVTLFVLIAAAGVAAATNGDRDFSAGLRAYNTKDYKTAVKYLKEYVSKKPDPTAYYLIGYSLYKQKKFNEADEYFKQTYLIDPEFSLEKVGLIKKQPAR